jgi:hypothetical protein
MSESINSIVPEEISNSEKSQKHSKDDSENETYGRREFLKMVGLGLATGAAAGAAGKASAEIISKMKKNPESIYENIAEMREVSSEMDRIIPNVMQYRKELGLEQLPVEMVMLEEDFYSNFISQDTWVEDSEIQVAMPVNTRSYGEHIKNTMEIIFGRNAGRLVKNIETPEDDPHGIKFTVGKRRVALPEEVDSIPQYPDFVDFILHEAAGHGSDPLNAIYEYPSLVFVKTEEGKWEALSKAFSVEGQFLNNPGDLMVPKLEKDLGAEFSRELISGVENPIKGSGMERMVETIEKIANQQNVKSSEVKFNKKACRALGSVLLEEKADQNLSFGKTMEKNHQALLDESLTEIYAEMVKYAILYPEKINNDEDIISGVKKVISAISGKEDVDLQELRREILEENREIIAMSKKEKELEGVANDVILGEAVQEDLGKQEEEVQEFVTVISEQQERKSDYERFMFDGLLPKDLETTLNEDGKRLLYNYAQACSTVASEYNLLAYNTNPELNWDFDPRMHIWEIEKVEEAIGNSYIRDLLEHPEKLQEVRVQHKVEHYTRVLGDFIGSEAFGT